MNNELTRNAQTEQVRVNRLGVCKTIWRARKPKTILTASLCDKDDE